MVLLKTSHLHFSKPIRFFIKYKIFIKYFHFGFKLLHTISDNHMMEKMDWFREIKFHLNENIQWHCL
jgi:hypothetical protein